MELEEGDIVLCTVDRIVGTIVFVKIQGQEKEGSIVLSEIAPGRIRNLRDYVVPKKRIVCKVLRISPDSIHLSLRRVTQKEKKNLLEQDKKEKSYIAILKKILGEKSQSIISKIEKESSLYDFLEESKENPKSLEEFLSKEDAQKLLEILKTQKKKIATIKKNINLTTIKPEGINLIKKFLELFKEFIVKYISAGKYSIESEDEDIKKADKKLKDAIEIANKESKKLGIEFSVKEK